MKEVFKFLTPAFTPFYDTDKKTDVCIYITWIVIFGTLWYNAPVLWPTFPELCSQLWAYLGFNFDSVSPFIHFKVQADGTSIYLEIFNSLVLTVISMVISIFIACLLAYASVTAFFKPFANMIASLRFMSVLGFLFIFMTLFHDASKVKVVLLVYSIVSFFLLSLLTMISRIDQKEYDLWTTLKYNKWEQLFEIIIYGKADYIVEAISSNFAIAWIMMTVAESQAMSEGGIGVKLVNENKYNHLIEIFSIQIIIYVLGRISSIYLKKLRYKSFPYTALAEKK